MSKKHGYITYKKHWEDQARFINQSPWSQEKVAKLTIENDFEYKLKELKFSNHSFKKEDGKLTLRLKVPYNFDDFDDFKQTTIKLLGIQANWLTDFTLDTSNCTKSST